MYPDPPPGILFFNNANSLAIDTQERIVVMTPAGNPFSYVVYRFNFDGSPDSSFSEMGRVIVPMSRNVYALTDVAIQPDNKIVGVGGAINPATSHWEFFVFRLQENGELDPSFGGTGLLWTPVTPGGGDDCATGVAIQPDGKIVVAERANTLDPSANFDFALVRYSSSGDLDDGFGAGGKVIISPLDDNLGRRAAIQPDGKIVILGYTCRGRGTRWPGSRELFS